LFGNKTMQVKIPTDEEYRAYDGAHCFSLWKKIDEGWRCPGCGRSKREIMRWTKRQAAVGMYWGWMAGLHQHHDHSTDRYGGRFSMAIICDQCNGADGQAKRDLHLPVDFSFSPAEIRRFITVSAHGRCRVDLEKAMDVFRELS